MDYDTTIIIEDNLGVIADEAELRRSLESFQEKTGITPAIVTEYSSKVKDKYLEDYAYNLYCKKFSDEKHWLIVYVNSNSSTLGAWRWEGMQGNDTDRMLSVEKANTFGNTFQSGLYKSKNDIGQALEEAFYAAENYSAISIDETTISVAIWLVLFSIIVIMVTVPDLKQLKTIS